MLHKAKQSKAKQSKAKQSKAKQSKAKQSEATIIVQRRTNSPNKPWRGSCVILPGVKTGTCPKCRQNEVYQDHHFVAPIPISEEQAKEMREWGEQPPVLRPSKAAPKTVTYACSACHYTETYLHDQVFSKPLYAYPDWTRVSRPDEGPFR